MHQRHTFEYKDRDVIADNLTEMLKTGAQQLIHQATQVELQGLLVMPID